jgi:hypothetical protein
MRGLLDRLRGTTKTEAKPVLPLEEIIFNVDNFNIWFRHPDNGAEYAHEGIYLRTDKLSESQVTDYLRKSYGLINGGFLFSKPYSEMISDLYKAVQKDWQNKRSNENNTDKQ